MTSRQLLLLQEEKRDLIPITVRSKPVEYRMFSLGRIKIERRRVQFVFIATAAALADH